MALKPMPERHEVLVAGRRDFIRLHRETASIEAYLMAREFPAGTTVEVLDPA